MNISKEKNIVCQSELKFESITNDFEKIGDKLKLFEDVKANEVQKLLQDLEEFNRSLQNNSESETDQLSVIAREELQEKLAAVKDSMSDLIKFHREIHVAISKFGKSIDKNFISDLSSLNSHFHKSPSSDLTDSDKEELMNTLILEHLLRQGYDEAAEQLILETGISRDLVDIEHFQYISSVVSSIRRGDLEPAKKWVRDHESVSSPHRSRLNYLLSKLDFLDGVSRETDNPEAVVRYARQLAPFAQEFKADFHRLMGSLVYRKRGLENSPYASLSPSGSELQESITEACHLVCRDVCLERRISTGFSPLSIAFASGCRALPRLHNLHKAMASLSKYGAHADVLPISVDVDPAAHQHNIFHCPIIKEVAVGVNCPVRLICGHAISREAFASLANVDRNKVKCPYCPKDTPTNQVQDLIF